MCVCVYKCLLMLTDTARIQNCDASVYLYLCYVMAVTVQKPRAGSRAKLSQTVTTHDMSHLVDWHVFCINAVCVFVFCTHEGHFGRNPEDKIYQHHTEFLQHTGIQT